MEENKFDLTEWVRYNKTFVNRHTGETLNKREVEQMVNQSIVIENQEQIDYATDLGLSIGITNVKYKNQTYECKIVKENCEFNKLFRVNWREFIEKSDMSANAYMAISKLGGYISFPTNAVLIKGKYPSIESLMKFLKLGRSTLYKVLSELEKEEVILRKKVGVKNVIYFNPFIISSGKFVTKDTYDMFSECSYM